MTFLAKLKGRGGQGANWVRRLEVMKVTSNSCVARERWAGNVMLQPYHIQSKLSRHQILKLLHYVGSSTYSCYRIKYMHFATPCTYGFLITRSKWRCFAQYHWPVGLCNTFLVTQCFLRHRNWITSHITSNQYHVCDMDLKFSVESATEMILKFYVATAWFLSGCPELNLLELTPPHTLSMEAKNVSSYLSYPRSDTEEGEIQLSSRVFQMGCRIYEPASPFITYINQVSISFYLISSVRSVH